MGTGIAWCFAQAGHAVTLYSRQTATLARAQARWDQFQALLVEADLAEAGAAPASERIAFSTDLAASVRAAEFVLESVPEDLGLKQQLFGELEALCGPETILATNTSGLSITAIASACQTPGRVVGMHWINPPEIVPLVEVVKGEHTTDAVLDQVCTAARRLGKVPVVVRHDVPGFASNRLQFALLREALHLVEAGIVSVADVDKTLRYGIGLRYSWLGPLETADLGGLEVFAKIAGYLFPQLSNAAAPPPSLTRLVEAGHLGLKTGQGFYEYDPSEASELLLQRDRYLIRQKQLLAALGRMDRPADTGPA